VLDDEQKLVMRLRERALGVEDRVEREVIGVGHAPVEAHLGAVVGGIVRGGHVCLLS